MPAMPGRLVAIEDRPVLGERHRAGRVLHRLPVGVLRAALDVVDGLPATVNGTFSSIDRLGRAEPRDHAVGWRLDVAEVTGADRRQRRRRQGPGPRSPGGRPGAA